MLKHVLWCIGHDLLVPDIVKAEGCYLFDNKGKKYMDLESGTWCVAAGHCNLEINEAIKLQLDTLTHTGYCYSHNIVKTAAQKVLGISGVRGGRCVFLCSGSEAVEFGVQLLQKISEKPRLMTMSDSFLSSYGSSAAKSKEEWHLFDWTACATCSSSLKCRMDCPKLKDFPFHEIGGFVFEPGSSSGLVRFPPKSLVLNIVRLVRKNKGFIQVNEITTGMGSTGKWFGFQHYGFQPDIVSIGKRLGNGYPVSAIAMSPQIIRLAEKYHFKYSQSHQNDPLGCAAANAVIDFMKRNRLVEKSEKLGEYLSSRLNELKRKYGIIRDVRGRGLMTAVEFSDKLGNEQLAGIYKSTLEKGYIIARRPGLGTFRIDPPLIITKKELDLFLLNFEKVLKKFSHGDTKSQRV